MDINPGRPSVLPEVAAVVQRPGSSRWRDERPAIDRAAEPLVRTRALARRRPSRSGSAEPLTARTAISPPPTVTISIRDPSSAWRQFRDSHSEVHHRRTYFCGVPQTLKDAPRPALHARYGSASQVLSRCTMRRGCTREIVSLDRPMDPAELAAQRIREPPPDDTLAMADGEFDESDVDDVSPMPGGSTACRCIV